MRTHTRLLLILGVSLALAASLLVQGPRLARTPVAHAQTAPGTVQQVSPANGATNQSATPTLTWNAPSGAISGQTTYTASLWAGADPPGGHLLGTVSAGTALSVQVPATEQLLQGTTYWWNVIACNGSDCSGYNPTWYAFTVAPHQAPSPSGAIPVTVPNGDFSGGSSAIPCWTGNASYNGSYATVQDTLTSCSMALDYSSENGLAWFRIGFFFTATDSSLTVSFNGNQVFSADTGRDGHGIWVEKTFSIAASAGASGQFTIQGVAHRRWPTSNGWTHRPPPARRGSGQSRAANSRCRPRLPARAASICSAALSRRPAPI